MQNFGVFHCEDLAINIFFCGIFSMNLYGLPISKNVSGKPRYFIDKFQCNNNTSIFTVFCLSQYQGIAIFQYIGLGTHITHSIKFILRSLMMNVLGNEVRQLAVKTPTYTENAGILGENLFPLLSWLISLSQLYRDYLE